MTAGVNGQPMPQDGEIAKIEQMLAQLELSRGKLETELARVQASWHYYAGQRDLLVEQRQREVEKKLPIVGEQGAKAPAGRVFPDVAAPGGPVETP